MPRMPMWRREMLGELADWLLDALFSRDHYLRQIIGHQVPAGQRLWTLRTPAGWEYCQTTAKRPPGTTAVLLAEGPATIKEEDLAGWWREVEGRAMGRVK